jgi:ABC-type Fe3+ transport system permease subunit
MPIAADYPFDVFRRDDIGGWGKAAWAVFVIVAPFLGVLVYLIAQHDGMRERSERQARAQREEFDRYLRDAAGKAQALA